MKNDADPDGGIKADTKPIAKPLIGVSACLLGEEVRFDGGHKRQNWMTQELSKHVDFVKVCPELEMGLGVPREALRLEEGAQLGPSLVTVKSGIDVSAVARQTVRRIEESLPELDGFILKSKSPSCGLERVKVYGEKGMPQVTGRGVFASFLKKMRPETPLTEEGWLFDQRLKDRFITHVYAYSSLRSVLPKISEIQKFHQSYKFLLLAYNQNIYRELGRIAANSEKLSPKQVLASYRSKFWRAFEKPAKQGDLVNSLQHMYGFFKDRVDVSEKETFLRLLEKFKKKSTGFLVVYSFLEHLMRKYDNSYIKGQKFFRPFPEELR